MPIVDNANVIIQAAFNCDIIISSSFLSVYLGSFSVMVL